MFRTGKGSNLRDISIGSCYKSFCSCHANTSLGFHASTGCDQTLNFMRKSKTFLSESPMNAEDKTLKALGDLGINCLLKSYYVIFFLVMSVFSGES